MHLYIRSIAIALSLALTCTAIAAIAHDHAPSTARPAGPSPTRPTADVITVSNAWIRATPPRAPVAGGFLSIRNAGTTADRLLSASTPDAERTEIHTMRMEEGVMRMRRLDTGVAVPPGTTATLAPGGEHLMFFSPTRRFVEGETVVVVLRFERVGERTVRFAVRAAGNTAHPH